MRVYGEQIPPKDTGIKIAKIPISPALPLTLFPRAPSTGGPPSLSRGRSTGESEVWEKGGLEKAIVKKV